VKALGVEIIWLPKEPIYRKGKKSSLRLKVSPQTTRPGGRGGPVHRSSAGVWKKVDVEGREL